MTYGSSTGSWKPWKWMRLNLILLNRDIHQFQPGHIHIASNRTSLRWSKNHCNRQKNSLKGKLIQTGKTTWSEFTIGGKAILIKKKRSDRAYYKPLLGATIAPSLVPLTLKKKNIFIRNCQKWHLFGRVQASKMLPSFKKYTIKTHH